MTMEELEKKMDEIGLRSITLTFGRSAIRQLEFFANGVADGKPIEQVRAESISEAVSGLLAQIEKRPVRREVSDLA